MNLPIIGTADQQSAMEMILFAHNQFGVLIVDDLHYQTIQSALNALPATGGTVLIAPGVYNENLVCNKPCVSLVGMRSPLGPSLLNEQVLNVVIQTTSGGTCLDIGSAAGITDPGWFIENISFNDPSYFGALYGLRCRRMRNLTLQNVQFNNFGNSSGAALFLDGTGGYNEFAHLQNVWFCQCSTGALLLNATDGAFFGGGMLYGSAGGVGINATGVSAVNRIFGTYFLDIPTAIILNGEPNDNTQMFGVRVECDAGLLTGMGIQVYTQNNLICGNFYGCLNGIVLTSTSAGNTLLACTYQATQSGGHNFTDAGTSNREI